MRKITFYFSMALMALLIMPQSMLADECEFTPVIFPGQAEDRTAYEVNATVHVGEGEIPQRSKVGSLDYNSIQSTNPDVVWASGRGAYFVGTGKADLTYTESNREQDCSSNHVIHYTVEKGTPVAGFMVNGEPVSEYTAALTPGADGITTGEDGSISGSVWTPPCVVRYKYFKQESIRFVDQEVPQNQLNLQSSNPEVATIDENGQVVATNLGETTISFSWPGNDNWEGVAMSYLLRVKKPVAFHFTPNEVTDSVSNVVQRLPKIVLGDDITISRWESSNPEVATVDKSGNVTMLAVGTTQITAIFDETEEYAGKSAHYTLHVVKKDPKLAFESGYQDTYLNFPVQRLPLANPYKVPVTYVVEDPYVVELSEDGLLTPKKEGNVKIGAMFEGNDTFNEAFVDYTLHITKLGVTVLNTEITAKNADDILGNGGKVKWIGHQLHIKDWKVDVSGMSDEIKEGVIKSEKSVEIKVSGVCSIKGAKTCIESSSSVAIFSETTLDTLKLEATGTAIHGSYLKFSNVAIRAKGVPSAIVLDGDLSMGRAYLYAEGTQYAIRCMNFNIYNEEDKPLEGIGILTENVSFQVTSHGFVIGGKEKSEPAPIVEIGWKSVVVSDEEETLIDFAVEDPYGNENVFFSTNAENRYNKETGQLEISTSLTDEQVAAAMESVVPGSSVWVSFLPGSLTFDVPAGKGEILIECMTMPGYSLKVKLEGEAAIVVTQSDKLGWVKVAYDVVLPTHVVIYLHALIASPVPAHIAAQIKDEEPSAGAFIKALKIVPANAPTGIEEIIPTVEGTQKIMLNGQIFIIRDGKAFNATGAQVR